VVWKDSTQLGCARASCKGIFEGFSDPANFIVCEYQPQGNFIGRFPCVFFISLVLLLADLYLQRECSKVNTSSSTIAHFLPEMNPSYHGVTAVLVLHRPDRIPNLLCFARLDSPVGYVGMDLSAS